MAHKRFTTPTSGSDVNKWYGTDHNKLVDSLQGLISTDPFTLNVDWHTFKHSTTNQAGDLLKGTGTRYSRWAKGTALQVPRVNAAGTDLEWYTPTGGGGSGGGFDAGGSISFSGNASTKVFNIPHGLGSAPGIYFAHPTTVDALGNYTTTVSATNITVTYSTAPPTGTSNLTFVWGAAAATAGIGILPLPYSFIIYKEGSDYKAKNGLTGAVHGTTSTTNVAAVINAVIDDLTTATGGGMVFITKGIFTQTTSIIMKDKIHLVGAGQSVTVLKLANNTAIDQIESFNFASLTNTNSLGGVGQVTIRDLTIDGNQANQSGAGGYGIKKYGWRWFLQNVIIKNTKKSGIYSEWCTDPNFPSGGENEGMDDHWLNVTVAACFATNCAVQFRGPHDTLIEGLYIAWAPNGAGMICEGNTNYDGNCRLVGCHIYSIKPETQALYIIGQNGVNTYVSATQCDIEGGIGVGGVGVLVDGSAQFKGTDCQIYLNETGVLFNSSIPCELHGCRIFSNTLGVKLQTSQHFLSECLWLSNQTGVLVQSISGGLNLNRITGHFKGHTAGSGIAIDLHDVGDLTYVNATVVDAIKGIRMGRSGQSLVNCVIHLQAYNCTTAAIDWADTSNSDNIVRASIYTASAGHAAVTGTPNHSTNDIWIKSSGAGTLYNTQSAANADTSGAALAALETEVNELKAALRRYGIIAT